MDRKDVGGWLSGPDPDPSGDDRPQDYRGQLLGRPPEGPGAVAGFGRRLAALLLDWFGAVLIVTLVSGGRFGFGAAPQDAAPTQAWTLAVFVGEIVLLTWLGGASAGQRVLGIGVVRIDGARLLLAQAVVRTLLLCLVIPPIVVDRDGRGLHDRAAGSVVVRAR